MKTDETQISKRLSYVLRHKPSSIEVELDSAGWIGIEKLLSALAAHGNQVTLDELHSVVENNDKKRFEISDDGRMIRASQGHSIEIDLGYAAEKPPELLYHGTAERFVALIKIDGLKKQDRHHVHMTESVETASKVGNRYGKLALLKIDASRMHKDGFVFFLSANAVWLTDHVPAKYISFPAN